MSDELYGLLLEVIAVGLPAVAGVITAWMGARGWRWRLLGLIIDKVVEHLAHSVVPRLKAQTLNETGQYDLTEAQTAEVRARAIEEVRREAEQLDAKVPPLLKAVAPKVGPLVASKPELVQERIEARVQARKRGIHAWQGKPRGKGR